MHFRYGCKIPLPNVLDVQKRGRAFLERGDSLFGISRRSSQCGVRKEPTERRQSARQTCAFLQLRHFEGQPATSWLPLCHEAVVLLREIKIPIMLERRSIYFDNILAIQTKSLTDNRYSEGMSATIKLGMFDTAIARFQWAVIDQT